MVTSSSPTTSRRTSSRMRMLFFMLSPPIGRRAYATPVFGRYALERPNQRAPDHLGARDLERGRQLVGVHGLQCLRELDRGVGVAVARTVARAVAFAVDDISSDASQLLDAGRDGPVVDSGVDRASGYAEKRAHIPGPEMCRLSESEPRFHGQGDQLG